MRFEEPSVENMEEKEFKMATQSLWYCYICVMVAHSFCFMNSIQVDNDAYCTQAFSNSSLDLLPEVVSLACYCCCCCVCCVCVHTRACICMWCLIRKSVMQHYDISYKYMRYFDHISITLSCFPQTPLIFLLSLTDPPSVLMLFK